MVDFWSHWPTPWTVEQARDRYVRGPRIGLRPLAKQSQLSAKTLEDRSRFDGWVEARRQFQGKTRAKTDQKTADAIADDYTVRSEKHLKAWEQLRNIAAQFFSDLTCILEAIKQGKEAPAEILARFESLKQAGGKNPFSSYSSALKTAIAGEREVLFMQYADVNILSYYANLLGYDLICRETGERIVPQQIQETDSVT